MNLSDPITFGRMYDEHVGGVRGAAFRILNNHAQAQDVAQDVFMQGLAQPAEVRRRVAASSAATCGSWRAAARSTSGARPRPPAARRTA